MKLLFVLLTVFSFAAKAPSSTGPVDADIRICLSRPESAGNLHWTFEVQDSGGWITVGDGLDIWKYFDKEVSVLHQSFTVQNPADSIRVRISCPGDHPGVKVLEGKWGKPEIVAYPGIPALDTTRVALVGNSFTFFFGSDFLLKRIARLHGHQIDMKVSLRGGASMTSHLNLERTELLYGGGPYDVVILQDQSATPAIAASDATEAAKILGSCGRIARNFTAGSPNARLIYECTWAYAKKQGLPYMGYGTCEKFDSLLRKGCAMVLAGDNGINEISPIGHAFQKAREQGLEVMHTDNHHQNIQGAYLKACVNYLMLFDGKFGENIAGMDCGLEPQTAARLRAIAADVYASCNIRKEAPLRDYVSMSINSESGFYSKGDTVRITATVKDIPPYAVSLGIFRNGRYKKPDESRSISLRKGETVMWEQVVTEPHTMMLTISSSKDARHPVRAGFIADPFSIRYNGVEPDDLMEFWNDRIAQMRSQKMKVKKTKLAEPEGYEGKVKVYDAVINCMGNRPAVAIVAEPAGARKGTLPIVLFFHGASMGKNCRATAEKAASLTNFLGVQCLAADVNAHGIDNHAPDKFYEDLFKGELKDYLYVKEHISKDEFYFRNMFLRDLRVLDYLTKNPLWDGKNIIVTGGSQGGAQSAWVASVEPRVTAMFVDCPAMWGVYMPGTDFFCSWMSRFNNMEETFFNVMPYYNMSALLKHTKAKCWVQVGQWDSTCPPACILSAYNIIPNEKVIISTPRIHTGDFGPGAEKRADDSRQEFIGKVIR